MRSARRAESGFSPLDEELQLLPGQLTPLVAEGLVRLGTWMPFARSAAELQYFLHVTVSDTKARRDTERAGAAYVAVQDAQAERLQRDLPASPAGVDKQLLSVDGAFVGVVGGEWVEVKTLTVGEIQAPVQEHGKPVVHTTHLSYFSRLSEASVFTPRAWVETYRRGVANSRLVCAITDGAVWNQDFVDWHRSDAVRILDFCHAAAYVADVGRAVHGEDTPAFHTWFAAQRQELKDGDPDQVLAELHAWLHSPPSESARQTVATSLNYLQTRRAMIAYAAFQQAGYPIGSGAGEACHKFVIEARLKGTGMRWAREHVNPLAALRNLVCNDRWEEGWAQVADHFRQQARPTPKAHAQSHATAESSRINVPATPHTPPTTPLLPSGFKLRPGTSWDNRPLGKARYRPSSEWPIAKK